MRKLKVLNKDLTSPFYEFKYQIGKDYICGDFNDNPELKCAPGFYATNIEGLPYSYDIYSRVFEVEVSGKQMIFDHYRQRFERITLVREVFPEEIISSAINQESKLGYRLSQFLFPLNPLLKPSILLSEKEVMLLVEWASLRDSVGASFGTSVWKSIDISLINDPRMNTIMFSVGYNLIESILDSIENSNSNQFYLFVDVVRSSVLASLGAYISSLVWQYQDQKQNYNPYQSAIELWNNGFVPSFDGEVWRLHTGKDANIVFEINQEELN